MAQKVTVVNMGKQGPANLKLVRPAQPRPPLSHLDKIRAAKTLDDLDRIVSRNDSYEHASPRMRARWVKAEQARRAALLAEAKK